MSDSATFEVLFQTRADTGGAKEQVAALKQVQQAAKDAGDATKKAGENMAEGASRPADSLKQLLVGIKAGKLESHALGSILEGDFTHGVKIATEAIKGLRVAGAASGLGLIAAAASLVLPVFLKMIKPSHDAADGLEKAGEKGKEAAPKIESVAPAAEKAANKMQAAAEAVKALLDYLKEIEAEAKTAVDALNQLEKAKLAADKAENEAAQEAKQITPAQRMKRDAIAERDQKQGEIDRQRDLAKTQITTANDAKANIQGSIYEKEVKVAGREAQLDQMKKNLDSARSERQAAQQALEDLKSNADGLSPDERRRKFHPAVSRVEKATKQEDDARNGLSVVADEIDQTNAAIQVMKGQLAGVNKRLQESVSSLSVLDQQQREADAKFTSEMVKAEKEDTKETEEQKKAREDKLKHAEQARELEKNNEQLTEDARKKDQENHRKQIENKIKSAEADLKAYEGSGNANAQKAAVAVADAKKQLVDHELEAAKEETARQQKKGTITEEQKKQADQIAENGASIGKRTIDTETGTELHKMEQKEEKDQEPEDKKRHGRHGRPEFHINAHATPGAEPQTPHTNFDDALHPRGHSGAAGETDFGKTFHSAAQTHLQGSQKVAESAQVFAQSSQQFAQFAAQHGQWVAQVSSAIEELSKNQSAANGKISGLVASVNALKSYSA